MWGYNLTETAAHTGPATSHHDGDERPRLSCHASPWGQDQSILHATDWSAACRLLAAWVAHGGMLHMTEPVLCVHTSWGGPNVCQGHSSNCCLPRVAFAGVAQRRLCALHHDRRSAAGVQQRRRVVTSRQRFFGAAMSHGHHTPHGESPGFARTRPAHPARSRPPALSPARSHPPVLTRPFSPPPAPVPCAGGAPLPQPPNQLGGCAVTPQTLLGGAVPVTPVLLCASCFRDPAIRKPSKQLRDRANAVLNNPHFNALKQSDQSLIRRTSAGGLMFCSEGCLKNIRNKHQARMEKFIATNPGAAAPATTTATTAVLTEVADLRQTVQQLTAVNHTLHASLQNIRGVHTWVQTQQTPAAAVAQGAAGAGSTQQAPAAAAAQGAAGAGSGGTGAAAAVPGAATTTTTTTTTATGTDTMAPPPPTRAAHQRAKRCGARRQRRCCIGLLRAPAGVRFHRRARRGRGVVNRGGCVLFFPRAFYSRSAV